jgi:outer membrane protein assembly factor BamB
VLVVGVAGVLQGRQQADVAAALEGDPGLLRPVHVLPTERWHLADAWVAGLGEQDVLVATPDGRLQGVEPGTGAVRWRAGEPPPGGSSWCTVLHRAPDGAGLTRVASGVRPAALVVCERGRWAGYDARSRVRLTTATVHDPVTGAVVAERTLDGGLLVSDTEDGDLLHAWADVSGRVSVVRWDPWTGDAVWTYRGDRRVTDRRSNGASVLHRADALTFVGAATLTVDLRTGEEVDRAHARPGHAPDGVVGQLAGGSAVVRREDVRSGPVTDVLPTDGSARFTVAGAPLLPWLRVGASAPVLLLTESDGSALVAVDARTGDPAWRTEMPERERAADVVLLAEVDGTAMLADGVEAWAVELASGTERWRLPLAGVSRLQPLTDGTVVVLPVHDGSPDGALVAVDVRSGAERWRLPLPTGTKGVRPAHGLLLVESRSGITALG